jgi:hypothetical protein
MKPTRPFLFWLFVLPLLACLGDDDGRIRNRVDATATILQRSLNQLIDNSTAWQQTLLQLERDLVNAGETVLANEVNQLVQRGIGTAGVEVRCNADFIGNRMRRHVEILLAQAQKATPPPPLPPTICQVSPDHLDMGHRPNVVAFYGYDLDAGVEVVLAHAGGEVSLGTAVSLPTHYLLTLDTSEGTTAPLCDLLYRRIVVRYGGVELSSVSVIDKECPGAPPPPPPAPARPYGTYFDSCIGGLFGCRKDVKYGGRCNPGYHREACVANQRSGNGYCPSAVWTSDDPGDCQCLVHFGVGALGEVTCQIDIWEAGDQLPAPPPPPCYCR